MGLRLKGKQYLAQCVQDLVKLKTFEKLLGTLDDFEIHLGLPIHVGTVTKPSSFVALFKHLIDMLQFSKGLIRIKSTNCIDCLLCAINNIESHSFSISQLGSLCWSVLCWSVITGNPLTNKIGVGPRSFGNQSPITSAIPIHSLCHCRIPFSFRSMKKRKVMLFGTELVMKHCFGFLNHYFKRSLWCLLRKQYMLIMLHWGH